jgi:hypothetical protein
MRRIVDVLLGAMLAGSIACACDDGGGGGGPGPELSELPAVYADTVCGQLLACYGDVAAIMGVTATDCETALVAQLEDSVLPVWEAADEAGTIEYDADRVQGCLDAIEAASCQVMSNRIPEGCDAIFNGTVEPGGPCRNDVECAGEAYCRGADCPGLCVARVEAGGACTDSGECVSGLTCQDETCALPAAEGEACEGGNPECAEGYLCAGADGETPGTCRSFGDFELVGDGESCLPDEGVLCQAGLSCVLDQLVPPTMTCVAESASGGACRAGTPDPCPDGQLCTADPLGGEIDGTCVPEPGDGEPCVGGVLGTRCAAGLRCDGDDICRSLERLGEPCASSGQCYSGLCEGGACASPECAF